METRLNPLESIMWKAGHDPALRMTVGIVIVLEHAPSYDLLAERFDAVIKSSPRLQMRPGGPSLIHACPRWLDAEAPAAEHHLRTAEVSRPGSRRELLDLVGLLEPVPFDPARAPWDATVIDGLVDGRAALYLRAHHVVTDGLTGLRLIRQFLDGGEITGRRERPPANDDGNDEPTIDLTKALRPLRAAVNAIRDPETLPGIARGVHSVFELAASVSRQVVIQGGALSPVLVDHSVTNRFEVMSVPRARSAAIALGGSRNDLLVAGAAFGLGLYHERLGEPCAELRLANPIGRRGGGNAGGNGFAPTRVPVPTGTGEAEPNLDVVIDRLHGARGEPALQLASALASTINYLPAQVLAPTLRTQAASVDFAATVLPGFGTSNRICGVRIESTYPFGPRLGCPVNLSAFGNGDRLDVGIVLDPAAIKEPEIFLECLDEAFATLVSNAL